MDDYQAPGQPLKASHSWLSILQLVFSALAAVLLLGASFTIVMVNLAQRIVQDTSVSDPTQSIMIAASLAFAGVLAVPSAWYAWKRIAHPDYEPPSQPRLRGFSLILTILVLLVVAGALWLGNLASRDSRISWLFLPPLNILATGLPAAWVVYIGTHGLIPGKPARKWGVFTSGLILGPVIILVLELIVLIGVGILALGWIMLNPTLVSQLNSLALRLQNPGTDPVALLRSLYPFLLNPGILILVFAYISLIVPMIEEALKPIGVWLLFGQKITPAQGFAFGVLCGAGFGLFENLGNTSAAGESWALLASARISTVLLHSLNTGLVGWGLASAWTQKRYLRLGFIYLYAIVMHGLWNGLAVLGFFSSLDQTTGIPIPANLVQLGSLSSIGVVALGAFNLVFFIGFSNALRRSTQPRSLPPSLGIHEIKPLVDPVSTLNDSSFTPQVEQKPDPDDIYGEKR